MDLNKKKFTSIIGSLLLSASLLFGYVDSYPAVHADAPVVAEANAVQVSAVQKQHEPSTVKLIKILEKDPETKFLLEKSIAKAAKVNGDYQTNPVRSLDDFYDFMDWSVKCMPWNVLDKDYPTLYEHIDQSIDYFWFLLDQPLEELEGRGYYYPTLQYHEPIRSWCYDYAQSWGEYLSTPESWNDDYYKIALNEKDFGLKNGWYADTNIWTSFNDFFSRKLVSPSVRPIADTPVVAPADSVPQGIWKVRKDGTLKQHKGVLIKSNKVYTIKDLIGEGSRYRDSFNGGTLTHTFLDVNDYHRYHFPMNGTVKEIRKIKAANAIGGITVWDDKLKKYKLECDVPGWQMVETRDCLILDTPEYGLVAILPIGMSQICSCNWEDTVKVGAEVKKGDPMGYFLFGGSDIVMVFQKHVKVNMVAPKNEDGSYKHMFMGEAYAELKAKK